MRKLKKLVSHPLIFLRDLLNKKLPPENCTDNHTVQKVRKKKQNIDKDFSHHLNEIYPVNFPIDVVYTWVNGNDERWLKRKKDNLQKTNTEKELPESTDNARFECRNELKYSIRSLEDFAPWVNHIYIVTDGQYPEWLKENSRLTVIDHSQIIPKQFLPTFNSHVIESHIHRIPGLSEHFIYFNDDVLLARSTPPEHFFSSNGNAHLFTTKSKTPNGPQNIYDSPTQKAAKNSREIINKEYAQYMVYNFAHTFLPQIKSVCEEIYKKYTKETEMFCVNKFRGNNDIAFLTYLSPNYLYLSGNADLRKTSCLYFNIRKKRAIQYYKSLLARRFSENAPFSMCLNDINVSNEDDFDYAKSLNEFLDGYFPKPSQFEISPDDKEGKSLKLRQHSQLVVKSGNR